MGSSAGSSQSMEQFCEDLQQETTHVVDEQSERIKDSNIYPAHYSQMTTMTLSSLARSNVTQTRRYQNLATNHHHHLSAHSITATISNTEKNTVGGTGRL